MQISLKLCITMFTVYLLARVVPCKACMAIRSPKVTEWGNWGALEGCSEGRYAVGFQLKTHRSTSGSGDYTGLNGIRLLCAHPRLNDIHSKPSSLVGPWGEWGREFVCERGSLLTGFQLRSESAAAGGSDNTAANNLRGRCTSVTSRAMTGSLKGDGTSWGDWTSWQYCPDNDAVCRIKTQVEPSQGGLDDTALNNVEMHCCGLPSETTCFTKATSKCEQYRHKCSECFSLCLAAASSFCSIWPEQV